MCLMISKKEEKQEMIHEQSIILASSLATSLNTFDKRYIEEGAYICPETYDLVDDDYCKSFAKNQGCRDYNICIRVKASVVTEDAHKIGEKIREEPSFPMEKDLRTNCEESST